jgi:diguanylate cyclase (GGDEF)-like protein/PAS domain S-box-containing protein
LVERYVVTGQAAPDNSILCHQDYPKIEQSKRVAATRLFMHPRGFAMRLDTPDHWQWTAIGQSAALVSGSHQTLLDNIVSHVVRATGCATALICRALDGELAVLAGVQHGPLHGVLPVHLGATFARTADRVQIQSIDAPPIALGFVGEHGVKVRFAAAVPVACEDLAYLMVLHDHDRPPLSAAQCYVLRAHAAHLATIFELATLREQSDIVDSAEHRANLERLRLLESVAVHARDSIIITEAEPIDLPGPRIMYCNAAFTAATGYSAADVIGQTPRILQGPKTDPVSRERLRRALTDWEPIEIELVNYRKDGTEFWVELSIVPVANERGWFTHWVSVQRDITERKNAEELSGRVRAAESENQALANEILERKRIEAELLYTAFHDSLTRLRNRPFFMDRLKTALSRQRLGETVACSVLFLDLDRFKVVNDSLGHVEGDALLKEVAGRLKKCVRPQDTLARLGGDEFAILIEDATGLSTPVRVAERIIESLRAPVQLNRTIVFPSCSIGIVQTSDTPTVPEDLIRDADIAMYEAKRSGFGDYAIFDASMHKSAVARLALQTDLRRAVEQKEFHLAYQPIVDPTSGSILSFEALLRWEHPLRGAIAPSDFVPVAEEIGLIRQIDLWVMREACAQLKEWQQLFANPHLKLSVNTSAAEFVDDNFVNDITSVLGEFGLAPECLELEITEGIFLNSSPEIAAKLAAVRRLGVRVALDDFGTGYSSLSYINRYPIDTIKIDKSFIDDVCTNQNTHAIVELIVKLGAALNLNIVAEGVETQDQADALVKIGCTSIQGYFFGKPMSADDVSRALSF